MPDDFERLMRVQFDAAESRFAHDEFADDFGTTIKSRVKRRRMVTGTAVGGGTVFAIGAIAVAAMYLPRATPTQPAATPGCSTWTPSPDPYPVVTVPPDASGRSYEVELPDGAGTMILTPVYDDAPVMEVSLPDGTHFTTAGDLSSGSFVFIAPESPLVVVAALDFKGDLQVTVGGVDAVVKDGVGHEPPRIVADTTPVPVVDCGTAEPSDTVASPFECGFHLDPGYRTDSALTITGAGYKTYDEAGRLAGTTFIPNDPVVSNIDPLVPYVTVVNNEVPGAPAGMALDPAEDTVDSLVGALTGVAVVKVQDGVVVAVPSDDAPDVAGGTPGALVVNQGLTALVLDKAYFTTCPGVTSTAYSTLYAVAGSQTHVRQQAKEPAIYVWQQLRGVTG